VIQQSYGTSDRTFIRHFVSVHGAEARASEPMRPADSNKPQHTDA
jgi:hypothetical protein